jgi:hypothetical protein
MATLAKAGLPSLASVLPPQNSQHAGLLAGEDIAAGDLCYIKSDGKIWRTNGTSVNAAAAVRGIALEACKSGEACTIMHDVNIRYGSGLTPGANLFASATAGAIDDAATTGGTAPIGYVVDATRIHVNQSAY